MSKIDRAIVSVSDKTGIVDFVKGLTAMGVEILSTGGTARILMENGVRVMEVSEYTGFPEIMDGRVKTLHPKIHGGLLGRRENPGDKRAMEIHGIKPIDMVVVNLYPFEATVAREGCTMEEAIENIDIGGPTMIRAAAKNYRHVSVLVDPDDYEGVLQEMRGNEGIVSQQTNFRLAKKVFRTTSRYDWAISRYLDALGSE
ncbi:MAG: IMP cyclohydrolase [Deltaproteobacteria bacterium]|nr:IMP cyclohydrolase [Deltaproteobacteria bacterium]